MIGAPAGQYVARSLVSGYVPESLLRDPNTMFT